MIDTVALYEAANMLYHERARCLWQGRL